MPIDDEERAEEDDIVEDEEERLDDDIAEDEDRRSEEDDIIKDEDRCSEEDEKYEDEEKCSEEEEYGSLFASLEHPKSCQKYRTAKEKRKHFFIKTLIIKINIVK